MKCIRTTKLNKKVDIIRHKDDFEPITVIDFFKETVEKFPNTNALVNFSENKHFISYQIYQTYVEKIAKIFIKLGLERHGVVAILAWNSSEWVISALGAIHSGGIVTGIYTTNSSEACQYILESSKAQILIVEDSKQLQKINEIKTDLPFLKYIIQIKNSNYLNPENLILDWNELLQIDTSDVEEEYEKRLKEITPNECCALIYTSGTSGFPKAAMLSHDNLIWNAKKGVETMKVAEIGNENLMSYLPLSHLAAFMSDIFIAIQCAATVHFIDLKTLKTSLVEALKEIQPTVFIGVPRVYEKIEEKINEKLQEQNFLKKKLFFWCQNFMLNSYFNPENSTSSIKYKLAQFIITQVKEALGFQHCKIFITGSAPMSETTKKFFISLNMAIYEAYGMTESSTVHTLTSHEIQIYSLNTVGRSLQFAETKIIKNKSDEEGEICIKGRHVFMGYLNNIEKTFETIDTDGWLHTGDIGNIENDLLYVTGRLKEILITSGGENIPAVRIENLVKNECNAISNAVLIGDKRKFLSILLTLKTEIDKEEIPSDELSSETCKWLKLNDLNFTKMSQVYKARNDQKLIDAFQNVIDRVNEKAIANPQKIQKFAILPQDFSIASDELTPTMKVKRFFVVEKYKDVIEKFYE
ncbi:hypothetical protein PVAND_017536 [Polypedilum vanderplanki]|uniref:long-chain-fatty-acid--CoA ligase n=1 Tax=Polypedilum vanderplanki TaxID=319348 RepID=A0A9J6BIK8_POLVA|nr:hypothetical protein PVAND_017536 [Polypedilum vanderplanki]